jgi:hypothetical protein
MYAIRSTFCSNLFYFKTRCIAPLVICFPSSCSCFQMDFIYEDLVAPPVTSNVKDENDTDNTSEEAQIDGYEVMAPLQTVKDEVVDEHIGSHSQPAKVEAKAERVVAAADAEVPTGHAAPVSSFTAELDAIISAAEADRGAVDCHTAAVEAPMVPTPPAYPPPAHVVAASAASSAGQPATVDAATGLPASVSINISWSQVVYHEDPVKGKVLDVRHAPISSPYPNMKFAGYQISKCNEFISVVFLDPAQNNIAGNRRPRPSGRECKAEKRRRDSVASSSSSAWSSNRGDWNSWSDASWGESSWSSAQWQQAPAQAPAFGECPWRRTFGAIDPEI